MISTIDIQASSSESFYAYVESSADPRPAVIICPEVFGVNSHMRTVAQRIAALGYMAVVPDMFWRISPRMEIPYDDAGLKRGSEILQIFDTERGASDLGLVVETVRGHAGCNGRIGLLGFCIGGTLAYLGAARYEVDAAVGYYAKGVENFLHEADGVGCPLMLHYAAQDRFIPPSTVRAVRGALEGRLDVQIFTYPGVDHGFNSDDRRAYNPEIAALAMQRTRELFHSSLGLGG